MSTLDMYKQYKGGKVDLGSCYHCGCGLVYSMDLIIEKLKFAEYFEISFLSVACPYCAEDTELAVKNIQAKVDEYFNNEINPEEYKIEY